MATRSQSSIPTALSCTLAAVTTTAISSPSASVAIPRLPPRLLFPTSSPVVAAGTPAAACTVCESSTTADGSSARPQLHLVALNRVRELDAHQDVTGLHPAGRRP